MLCFSHTIFSIIILYFALLFYFTSLIFFNSFLSFCLLIYLMHPSGSCLILSLFVTFLVVSALFFLHYFDFLFTPRVWDVVTVIKFSGSSSSSHVSGGVVLSFWRLRQNAFIFFLLRYKSIMHFRISCKKKEKRKTYSKTIFYRTLLT